MEWRGRTLILPVDMRFSRFSPCLLHTIPLNMRFAVESALRSAACERRRSVPRDGYTGCRRRSHVDLRAPGQSHRLGGPAHSEQLPCLGFLVLREELSACSVDLTPERIPVGRRDAVLIENPLELENFVVLHFNEVLLYPSGSVVRKKIDVKEVSGGLSALLEKIHKGLGVLSAVCPVFEKNVRQPDLSTCLSDPLIQQLHCFLERKQPIGRDQNIAFLRKGRVQRVR
mmetsp:Transcript_1340/g.2790  ORF Transcript_1340/g.2790 Transcript_1340/m.2790 type:complete len:228 (-) Transcript_1340:676-1359(-)